MSKRRYWLVKTEPESFSIDDLAAAPDQTTCWDGVRNYQARNYLRDGMKRGDEVLFYHSSADPTGVAGTCVVAREAYPDPTAWDKNNHHYDPKASAANPIWVMVDLKLKSIFPRFVTLAELRGAQALAGLELLRRGSRLSVHPVTADEFRAIVAMGKRRRAASL